jgi:hypothetical protein
MEVIFLFFIFTRFPFNFYKYYFFFYSDNLIIDNQDFLGEKFDM